MSHWRAVNSSTKRKVETAALRPRLNTSFLTPGGQLKLNRRARLKKKNEFVTAMKPSKRYSKEEKKHTVSIKVSFLPLQHLVTTHNADLDPY